MVKAVWTFTFIVIGMMLLLAMAGVETGSSYMMKKVIGADSINETPDIESTPFFSAFKIAIGLLSIASIVMIGVLGRQTVGSVAAAGLATGVFAFFLGDMVQLINIANGYATWAGMAIKLLVLPLCMGYIMAIFDWVRGSE